MLERIYKQYVKNVNRGVDPMEFIKSLDVRVLLQAMNEMEVESGNIYNTIFVILDKWYKKEHK